MTQLPPKLQEIATSPHPEAHVQQMTQQQQQQQPQQQLQQQQSMPKQQTKQPSFVGRLTSGISMIGTTSKTSKTSKMSGSEMDLETSSDEEATQTSSEDTSGSHRRGRLLGRLSSGRSFLRSSTHSPSKGSTRRPGSSIGSFSTTSSSILTYVGECSEAAWNEQPSAAKETSNLTSSSEGFGEAAGLGPGPCAQAFCSSPSLKPRRLMKILLTVAVLGVHCYVIPGIWFAVKEWSVVGSVENWTYCIGTMFCVTVPLVCWLFFEWIRTESSFMARQASWLFLFTWASTSTTVMCMVTDHGTMGWFIGINVNFGKWAFTILAIWARVSMAEKAFLIGTAAREQARGAADYIMMILWLPLPITLATDVPYVMYKIRPEIFADESVKQWLRDWLNDLTLAVLIVRAALFIVIAVLVWWAYSRLLHPLQSFPADLKKKRKFLAAEVEWASPVVRRVRLALLLLCFFGSLYNAFAGWVTWRSMKGQKNAVWYEAILAFDPHANLWCIADFFTLLMIVSCFRSQTPETLEHSVNPQELAIHQCDDQEAWPEWHNTVKALAQRYITAGELLDFYKMLGTAEVMPHFQPGAHTMNDIVRGAIIPKSHIKGRGGFAYADLLAEHRREEKQPDSLFAQRMVTHEWRNLFAHTVAAVLADALSQKEYGRIALQLESAEGLAKLTKRLGEGDAWKTRYWICSFCVNQHRGICGSIALEPPLDSPEYPRYQANACDSVTKQRHGSCDCGLPKIWEGDLCEMNKFEDLMAFLSCKVPSFRQVVAIDRNLGLFNRVWCVAELVEARRLQIFQNVLLPWKRLFDANTGDIGTYLKLATISVEDCSAAVEEDKTRILDKIRNANGIEEFDAQLQATIFGDGGLFTKDVVGFDVIHSAARAALRAQVAAAQAEKEKADKADKAREIESSMV